MAGFGGFDPVGALQSGVNSLVGGARGVGSDITDLGYKAGNQINQFGANTNASGLDVLRRGVGRGTYDSFDPGWSINNPFTMRNPWGAARGAGALFTAGAMGGNPWMGGSPGSIGLNNSLFSFLPMSLGGLNANLYSNYTGRLQDLDTKAAGQAQTQYNADMSNAGASGMTGSIANAGAAMDVGSLLRGIAQQRQAVQNAYQAQIMDQLTAFMSMFGSGVGGSQNWWQG